jgi:non-specific serine/threonine protein kinase
VRGAEQRGRLASIAADLAERRPVDWEALGRGAPDLIPLIRQFAVLEGIAMRHARADLPPGVPASGTPARLTAKSGPPGVLPSAWGPLELRQKIGEGTFGQVFRAYDPKLEREVALKLGPSRSPSAGPFGESLYLKEARRLARVRHPNVVSIHGIEEHEGRIGLWTDLLEGQTLEQLLEASGPLSTEDLLRVGIDLSRALAAIHNAGVLHGDIKAPNAIREPDGNVVLMDFGAGRFVARAGDLEGESSAAGLDGPIFGTPVVVAPEVLEGNAPDAASDLYSLGVLLYRLAAGRYPVEGTSVLDQRLRLRSEEPVPLAELRPDLPPVVTRAIHRALARDPAGRFGTAAQFEGALAAGLGDRDPALDVEARAKAPAAPGLPLHPTRFIGRRKELAEIRERLEAGRWVTLTGCGGSGKTRLAVVAAEMQAGRYPDGVRWIDLSGLDDPRYVADETARALGLRARPGVSQADSLLEGLRSKSILLAVDNAEHLRAACRDLAESLLAHCPGVTLLVTSREPLGGSAESVYEVAPLGVPPERVEEEPGALDSARYDAVRLFIDRAHLERSDFRFSPANAGVVAAICRRLDGLPLPIELAASRVRAFSLDEILRRLEQSLGVLSGRDPAVARHATVQAMLEWSYRLLTPGERALLARLSVFHDGWTLVAAEHVCADQADESPVPEIPRRVEGVEASSLQSPGAVTAGGEEILELMESLVRRSFIRHDGEGPEGGRYGMFAVARRFAREKLRQSREEAAVVRRHVRYFLLLAAEGDRRLFGSEQAEWLRRFEREHANFQSALAATREDASDPATGLRLACHLGRPWAMRGLFHLGRSEIAAQLERPECRARSKFRAFLLTWAGIFSYEAGDFPAAVRFHEESKSIQEERGDRDGIATSLAGLGDVALRTGEIERARTCLETNVAIMREIGDPARLGIALNKLALLHLSCGELDRSRELQEEHLAVERTCGHLEGIATALTNLGTVLKTQGLVERAMECYGESLAIRRRIGERNYIATTLNHIASVHLQEGRLQQALPYLRETLSIQQNVRRPQSVGQCLEVLGSHAERMGRPEESLRFLSASLAVRESAGEVFSERELRRHEERIRSLRETPDPSLADRAWTSGRAMTLSDAIEFGLAYIDRETSPPSST